MRFGVSPFTLKPVYTRGVASYQRDNRGARAVDLVGFDVDGTLVSHPQGKVIWQLLMARYEIQIFRSTEAARSSPGRNPTEKMTTTSTNWICSPENSAS